MPIERKKTLNVFKDAREAWGSYDDYPVGQPGTDPMPHLSRNRCPQPFFLVSEADQVLIQMVGTRRDPVPRQRAGAARARARRHRLHPGLRAEPDRSPRREHPDPPQGRAGRARGGRVVLRVRRGGAVDRDRRRCAQAGAYLAAVHAFNASARACPSCARVHPLAELGDIAWADTAAALR